MKKQDLLSTLLVMILLSCSLTLKALELQQDATNAIFTDAELSQLLNTRPFEDTISRKAAQRLKDIFADNLKKSKTENLPPEKISKLAECLAGMTLMQVISTPAFEKKLAKPEQLMSDYTLSLNTMVCTKAQSVAVNESPNTSTLSVNDLILDFSSYYGKEVIVKGYIVYNDVGSYFFHTKGNANAIFLNNDRLSRDSKKYLMGCGGGCEVTLKVRPSEEDSVLMKTAYALSIVK